MTADILIDDVPPRYVTFWALKSDEVGFLRWLAKGAMPVIEAVHVDELSVSVRNHDADYIYQQLLLNGLVIEFPDGTQIQCPGGRTIGDQLSKMIDERDSRGHNYD